MKVRTLPGSGPSFFSLMLLLLLSACVMPEGDENPQNLPAYTSIDVPYGAPALVVLVNPELAGASTRSVPLPGASVADVYVQPQGGTGRYTDTAGVAVLSGVSGYTTLTLEGRGESGQVSIQVGDSGLTEVAIALRPDGAFIMSQVSWGGSEGSPYEVGIAGGVSMTTLSESGQAVIVPAGRHDGDLEVRGDNIIVYGEGFRESWPLIAGDVRIYGKNVQLRGVWIEGGLEVNGHQFTMTMGGVDDSVIIAGNNATFLDAVFCAGFRPDGSNLLIAGSDILPHEPICSDGE